MEEKVFSKKEALQFGWETIKKNVVFFIKFMIILSLFQVVSGRVEEYTSRRKVMKEDFAVIVMDPAALYKDLIKNRYVDLEGVIQDKFIKIGKADDLEVSEDYISMKPDIFSIMRKAQSKFIWPFALLGLMISAVGMIISIGCKKISLKFCDHQMPELSDLYAHAALFVKYALGSILYGLILLAGFLLLIIPGIIFAIKYQFFAYFIIDKGMGPVEAIKASSSLTHGVKRELFVFGALLGLINLAGMLCFLVGLLVTIPCTMLAYAYVYRRLLLQEGGEESGMGDVEEAQIVE